MPTTPAIPGASDRQTEGTIAAADLTRVLEGLERRGVEVARILALAQIRRASLSDPLSRVPAKFEHRLWDAVETITGDAQIGVRLGAEHARHGPASLLEYIALHSPTLREALQGIQRVVPLYDDRGHFDILEEGDEVRIGIRRDGIDRAPGYVDFVCAVAHTVYCEHLENFQLSSVHLKRPPPSRVGPYLETFGMRPHFSAGKAELVFPRRFLEEPLRGADLNMGSLLQDHATNLLEQQRGTDPFVNTVRRSLARAIQSRTAGPGAVAKATGTSVRTLRRRLRAAGTSYRELLDELRYSFACHRLERTDDSIDAIADTLGFSSRTAFQRAFKRYAEQSPSQYRAAHRRARP